METFFFFRFWTLKIFGNIGSTGERGPAADFSRGGGRERVPSADFLSAWRSRVNPRLALSLDRPVERECQARISLGLAVESKSAPGTLSRPPGREKSAAGPLSPVEPILALQGERCQARISLGVAVERTSVLGTLSPCRTVKGSIHAYKEQRRGWSSFSTAGSEQIGGWHFFPLVATFQT